MDTPEYEETTTSATVAGTGGGSADMLQGTILEGVEDDRRWYVIHTYSGYENKVKKNLEHRILSHDISDRIFRVEVPTVEEIEIRSGQRHPVQRKIFPGYVLVEMVMDEGSWYVVRNTPGVTGFVGAGATPVPLSQPEVDRILHTGAGMAAPQHSQVEFQLGESVKITSGPLADFDGEITDVNADAQKLQVMVNIFERQVPVEVGFDNVKKLD